MELFAKLFNSLLVLVYHCFDRIVIHGYLSSLSRPEQAVFFFHQVLGTPVVDKTVLSQRTNDYRNWVEAFARNHRTPIEWAEKGVRKEAQVLPGLRRRSRKMLGKIYSRPASAWQRTTLDSLTRTFRTPRVLDEFVALNCYDDLLRQLTVIDLGHEEPTVLLTNNFKINQAPLITRYAQRMLIENSISESIQFFHMDALSSMVGLKVDFDLQLTLMAGSLYRLMARRIGREYQRAQPKTIFRNLLDLSAKVAVETERVVVTIDKRAHNPYLVASGLADKPAAMPWFGNKQLHIRCA